MRLALRRIAAVLIAAGLLGAMGFFGATALATTSDESSFASRIASERSARGVRAIALDAGLSDVARRHSRDMADRNELYHNDNLGNEVSGWQELDENVGEGGSVEDIHAAFMNSQVHRDAILGNYEKVGIGTTWKNGTLWVTQVFYRAYQAPHSSSRVQRAPARQPAPRAVQRTVRRPAAPAVPPAAASAPIAPIGVAVPELSSGKLEKLLGDLVAVPSDSSDPIGDGPANVVPLRRASESADSRLGSALWEIIDTQAS